MSHRSYFVVNLTFIFFSFIVYKNKGRYLFYVFPHFILSIYFCLSFVCVKVWVPQSYLTLCDPMDYSPPSSSAWRRSSASKQLCMEFYGIPWNSPGENTGVGYYVLLQAIFPTQGLNLGLLHYRQILSLPSEPPGKLHLSLSRSLININWMLIKFSFWFFFMYF